MDHQRSYRNFSDRMADWPFYLKDWWLDATCTPTGWDAVCLTTNRDGDEDAVLPFEVRRKWGLKKITTPEFTPWSGPWFSETQRHKAHKIMAEFEQLMTRAFENLPAAYRVDIRLSPDVPYGLPALWAGPFRESVMYTYRLSFQDAQHALENFNRTARKEVQAFEGDLFTPNEELLFDFMAHHNLKYTQRQIQKLRRIYSALRKRNKLVIRAVRKDDTLLGAIMGVTDHEDIYLLCSGINKSVRPNPAFNILIHDLMKEYEGRIKTIDFMGSQDPAVAHSFRSLGAIPMGIRRIEKKSLLIF